MTAMAWWRRALGVAAAAIGASAVAMLPAAAATEPAAVGWWWVGRPSVMLPALFSPEVPDGGLYVAGEVGGPSGVSALRYELGPDATALTLTLTIADATGTVAIDACPAKDTWEPAANGGWDQRASPDCGAASVTGTVDDEGTEVSFSLFSLQGDDGVIDVVLIPSVDPDTGDPARFEVAFEAPGAEALAIADPAADSADNAIVPAAPTPSFAAPPVTAAPPPVAETLANETAVQAPAAPSQPTSFAAGVRAEEGFAYAAVLALPLVLLCGASYLGWALTRPVTVTRRLRGAGS